MKKQASWWERCTAPSSLRMLLPWVRTHSGKGGSSTPWRACGRLTENALWESKTRSACLINMYVRVCMCVCECVRACACVAYPRQCCINGCVLQCRSTFVARRFYFIKTLDEACLLKIDIPIKRAARRVAIFMQDAWMKPTFRHAV